jgi:hypothetical protein
MAKTNWKMDDTVMPADFNQIGQELNALQADGSATDDRIGDRTISDTTVPTGDTGKLTGLLNWLAYMIKAITGKSNWRTAPATNLEASKAHMDDASRHVSKDNVLQLGLNSDMVDGFHASLSATPSTAVIRDGTGDINVRSAVFSMPQGTNPFSVISTTTVPSLSADMVDGFHADISYDGNKIVAKDASGVARAMVFRSGIATGSAPFIVESTTIVSNLNADMVDGLHTNAGSVGNTIAIRQPGAILQSAQFVSTIAQGTSPLTVVSNTLVTNLNADLLDGYHAAVASTANTVAVRDGLGNVLARRLISDVAQGTAPLQVTSTTMVEGMNVEMHGGWRQFSSFASVPFTPVGEVSMEQNIASLAAALPNFSTLVVSLNASSSPITGLSEAGTLTVKKIDTSRVELAFKGLGSAKTMLEGYYSITNSGFSGWKRIAVANGLMQTNLNSDSLRGFIPSSTSESNTVALRNAGGELEGRGFIARGRGIKVRQPDTTGSWAHGVVFESTDGSSVHGGTGVYGNSTTVERVYLAVGDTPYSNGLGVYVSPSGNVGVRRTNPTAPLDVNGKILTNNQFQSTVAQGTAPLQVASSTVVQGLNVEMINGWKMFDSMGSVGMGNTSTPNEYFTALPDKSILIYAINTNNNAPWGITTTGTITIKKHTLARVEVTYISTGGQMMYGIVTSSGNWGGFYTVAAANGITQTNLNAEMVGGLHAADIATPFAETYGSATVFTANVTPAFEKVSGRTIRIQSHIDTTGSYTLNVNGTGAAPIKTVNGKTPKLKLGGIYTLTWDDRSGSFILQGEGGGEINIADLNVDDVLIDYPDWQTNGIVSNNIILRYSADFTDFSDRDRLVEFLDGSENPVTDFTLFGDNSTNDLNLSLRGGKFVSTIDATGEGLAYVSRGSAFLGVYIRKHSDTEIRLEIESSHYVELLSQYVPRKLRIIVVD